MSTDLHIRRSAEDYAEVIANDLPTGPAWPRDADSILMQIVDGLAVNWGRVDGRIDDLLSTESDPRGTFEMLSDWEAAFGLPDICDKVTPQTIEERRSALVAKIAATGGQSREFFINQAAGLGYTVTIYEYAPYTCGLSVCGETRPDGTLTEAFAYCGTMESGVDPICLITETGGDEWQWQLGADTLRYFWKVKISGTRVTWFRGGTGECGQDHLCEIAIATDLECLMRREKPAHTEVIFDYSSADLTGSTGTLDASKPAVSAIPLLFLF